MNMEQYTQLDAHDLALHIRQGAVTAQQAIAAALEQIKQQNPLYNAITHLTTDYAFQALAQMSGQEPFYGVPIVVKDLGFAMKGQPMTAGSRFLQHVTATYDADWIRLLKSLGFVPIARTNTPELGLSYVTEPELFGPCRNPLDIKLTPGGSSGGSAVAVRTGMTPIATASDGGGSIRIPAACCGLPGFKPTHGLMPTGPQVAESWSGMATSFVLTRSLRDLSAVFEAALSKSPFKINKFAAKSLKIAEIKGVFTEVPLSTASVEALETGKQLLNHMGHTLLTCDVTMDLVAITEASLTIIAANTFAELSLAEQLLKKRLTEQDVEPATWTFYQRGRLLSAADLVQARNQLYQQLAPLRDIWTDCDVIISPTLAASPLAIGSLSSDMPFDDYLMAHALFTPFTSLFNQSGLPAISLPISNQASIQLATRAGYDWLLIDLAQRINQHIGFSKADLNPSQP